MAGWKCLVALLLVFGIVDVSLAVVREVDGNQFRQYTARNGVFISTCKLHPLFRGDLLN
jgi:hypothetical protein